MSDDDLKLNFGGIYDKIVIVLTENDIMRLISSGAPDDEYEPEARTILPRLKDCHSSKDVRRVIMEEFKRWFGYLPLFAKYSKPLNRAANDIWEAWINTEIRKPLKD